MASINDKFRQEPEPSRQILLFRGDTIDFKLFLNEELKGSACLRTNLGQAGIKRLEIIEAIEKAMPVLSKDWVDIPMNRVDSKQFHCTIPLTDIGHFEAKCFFLPQGDLEPVWPPGANVEINVEPASTCSSNIIYNAFVRQFGVTKSGSLTHDTVETELLEKLDAEGYTIIPPSGTFRDLQVELDFIMGELGCRIIQLLPIHPTPTTYARMGRFGSPFAALSFTSVDPAQAVFDPVSTPLEQFIELVDEVHARNGLLFLDIAINHTGWASELHGMHPAWLLRDEEGRIEVPGAWGVEWADLTRLDYSRYDLWEYMAKMFLTWCRRGIDGFRCDAGYMIPVSAWKYIVAVVREEFPDTVFFLEGLGGKISVMRELLNKANLNWAYSELFQNYNRSQVESYLPGAFKISESEGLLIHFAETHDNARLASRSASWARLRVLLCALCSPHGGFGFANGVEWLATEKIDVHGSPSLNWGADVNLVKEISRINRLLKHHPSFSNKTDLKLIQLGGGNTIVLLRHHRPSNKRLLILANLDEKSGTVCSWNPVAAGINPGSLVDLVSGRSIRLDQDGDLVSCRLNPGEVLCLSPDLEDLKSLDRPENNHLQVPQEIRHQELMARVLDVLKYYQGIRDITGFDIETAVQSLVENPLEFCRQLNPFGDEARVIQWFWQRDANREVMIPPGFFLLIRSSKPIRLQLIDASLENGSETERVMAVDKSLPLADGSFFCLIPPLPVPEQSQSLALRLTVFGGGKAVKVKAPILLLSESDRNNIQAGIDHRRLLQENMVMLDTNNRGGMLHIPLDWTRLSSKYDAFLAANLNPDFPEDRWIMWTRCRGWVVFQGYSQVLDRTCLHSFSLDGKKAGVWHYRIPTGQGQHICLEVTLGMVKGENATRLGIYRLPCMEEGDGLPDEQPVQVIFRPDIEDRNFHYLTKAYTGPENSWPEKIKSSSSGFVFQPENRRRLKIDIAPGQFIPEPEWQYMVERPSEEERGMDHQSDLFSPGYFSTYLKGDESAEILGRVVTDDATQTEKELSDPEMTREAPGKKEEDKEGPGLEKTLLAALEHYLVEREDHKSIIAGYPWFLDWGRDSLITCRGLIAADRLDDVKAIISLFGRYEERGTLPNMIHGTDLGNRDTSDAPLWFVVVCRDLADKLGLKLLLELSSGSRPLREILLSIGYAYREGTPNGIRMDPDSGLIFSPSHFTWMDTDHPAGTPRQGYCIEIQALWYAVLKLLAKIESENPDWMDLQDKVRKSVEKWFFTPEGYLADCLHADPETGLDQAEVDASLRPNQLLALTMELIEDKRNGRKILESCQELLVPGAIRSLADRRVDRPLPISLQGQLLNDPYHPYQGKYRGDEDRQRKPAYHNGTAWTWLFPSFCEAWVQIFGDAGMSAAKAWLASSIRLINNGCVGHVPEITDGDYPHLQRGCDAQAWGASELLRVWLRLQDRQKIQVESGTI